MSALAKALLNLLIKNAEAFEYQEPTEDTPQRQEVLSQLKNIGKEFEAKYPEIEKLTRKVPISLSSGKASEGAYFPFSKSIKIHENISPARIAKVLEHEALHHVVEKKPNLRPIAQALFWNQYGSGNTLSQWFYENYGPYRAMQETIPYSSGPTGSDPDIDSLIEAIKQNPNLTKEETAQKFPFLEKDIKFLKSPKLTRRVW